MSITSARFTEEQLYQAVLDLKGDEQIFIPISDEAARQLRYLEYKRIGLESIVMSYINSTHEAANQMNFQRLVEEIAQLEVNLWDIKRDYVRNLVGERVYALISMQHIGQRHYRLDNNNNVLIIEVLTSSHGINKHGHACSNH